MKELCKFVKTWKTATFLYAKKSLLMDRECHHAFAKPAFKMLKLAMKRQK
jgi:hypothetical protein